MFQDRFDAGRQLAEVLAEYRDKEVIVLAIPRGGVPVAVEIAQDLNADFSILVSRKLPFPDNPEAGFGAMAEDGSLIFIEHVADYVSESTITRIVKEQREVIARRIEALRRNQPFPDIAGKNVILVDDGIAMGSTMKAAVKMCRNKGAGSIVVAVPVAGPDTARRMSKKVDELVALETPQYFRAVAQSYRNRHDVTDAEVRDIMERFRL